MTIIEDDPTANTTLLSAPGTLCVIYSVYKIEFHFLSGILSSFFEYQVFIDLLSVLFCLTVH